MRLEPHAKEAVIDDVGSMIYNKWVVQLLHILRFMFYEAQITQFFLIYANNLCFFSKKSSIPTTETLRRSPRIGALVSNRRL